MIHKLTLFLNTVKYLKLVQIFNRLKRKLIKPTPDLKPSPSVSTASRQNQNFIECLPRMLSENRFDFLNKIVNIQTKEDWNSQNQDKLWLYNLHYFDDLNSINSIQRYAWHAKLIERWIDENPPGFGNGWEAYPSSLRIVNWIKWSFNGRNFEKKWIDSLAIQVRYLSNNLETHLLGNHLFANAKALIFAGLFFKGSEADNWYQIGKNIIEAELDEQVHSDGGNFELSPMYHSIFIEDLLDLVNIHNVYDQRKLSLIEKKIPSMLYWLKSMIHPDGEISFFNDAALGIAPSYKELIEYSHRLGIKNISDNRQPLEFFKNSGYIRVEKENLVSIIDVANIGASYIPGHGHADTLSFELSLFGQRLIVNSGTSIYGRSNERHLQRSTLSHSSVVIDEKNSSEVWSGFRVARRANVSDVKIYTNESIVVSASHDGYTRLKGSPMHQREWRFNNNEINITDNISGKGIHSIQSILPLHPDVKIINTQEDSVELKLNEDLVKIVFEGEGKLKLVSSRYHPEFGLSLKNKKLVYIYSGKLPRSSLVKILWGKRL